MTKNMGLGARDQRSQRTGRRRAAKPQSRQDGSARRRRLGRPNPSLSWRLCGLAALLSHSSAASTLASSSRLRASSKRRALGLRLLRRPRRARGRRSPASRASCRGPRGPCSIFFSSRSMRASSASLLDEALEPHEDLDGAVRARHDAHGGAGLARRRRGPRHRGAAASSRGARSAPACSRRNARTSALVRAHGQRHLGLLVDVVLAAHRARRRDDLLEQSPSAPRRRASSAARPRSRRRVRPEGHARLARRGPGHALPELLGDEGHERVQQAQRCPRARRRASRASRPRARGARRRRPAARAGPASTSSRYQSQRSFQKKR